ncbi:MAG TPA: hypothetical protein VHA75_05635 [Rugosimonospora sp.]|nr:hypothetical protein [Rugosimonospora sp.]
MTDEPSPDADTPPHRPGPFPPTIDRPVPHPPQPVIEGVVVADSVPDSGPVVRPVGPVPPVGPLPPVGSPPPLAPSIDFSATVHQEPVAGTFIGGALYAFVVRTACFLLTVGYLMPVNALLTGVLRGSGLAYFLLAVAEFGALGSAALAAVVVGTTARIERPDTIARALLLARVYFWADLYYLATVLVGGLVVIVSDTVPGGIWLLLVGLPNVPLVFFARTLIRRTRWVSGRRD